MVIVFEPTFIVIEPDGEPEVTGVPLTVTVALAWLTVGVTVKALMLFATLSVYEMVDEENAGVNVPELMARLLSVASEEDPGPKSTLFTSEKVVPAPVTILIL